MNSGRPVRFVFSDRSGWLLWGVCALVLWMSGCTSPGSGDSYHESRSPSSRGAPDWVGEPEGWAKLERIENWLATDAYRFDPYWQIQGELDLSEGRLDFASTDHGTAAAQTASYRRRVDAARSGFERVLHSSNASPEQTERARIGLARLDLLTGNTAPVPEGPYLSRATWRARTPIPSRLTPAGGPYNRITIHHTADVPGARFDGSLGDSINALHSIQRNHMDNRRYGDIGYHFLIDPAGRVFTGRDLRYQGAHAGGTNNRQNLGICLLGNFEKSRPTAQSLQALDAILVDLRTAHHIGRTSIVGHGELKSTLCPGAHLLSWTKGYRSTGPSLASLTRASSRAAQPTAAPPRGSAPPTASRSRSSWGGSATVR